MEQRLLDVDALFAICAPALHQEHAWKSSPLRQCIVLALSHATCPGFSADFAQVRTRSMTVEAAPTGTAMRAMHRPLRHQPARGRRKLRLNVSRVESRALRKGRRGRSERDAGTRVPKPERSQAIMQTACSDRHMLARRMLAGRTLSVLQSSERSSLFRTESSTGATTAALQPAVGRLAASLGNSSVLKLSGATGSARRMSCLSYPPSTSARHAARLMC